MKAMETPTRRGLQKVKEAKLTIDENLKTLAEEMRQGKSVQLKHYLEVFSQFHHYSFGNLILAWSQRRTFTRLAGIRQWNKMGRTVKRGERGIVILAPIQVRRKELAELQAQDVEENGATDEPSRGGGGAQHREKITFYKPVYVFDVEQTEGDPLPELISATGDASALLPLLEAYARAIPVTLEYVEVIRACPGALGVSMKGKIQIVSSLDNADRFRTLAHEIAHELLHNSRGDRDKRVRETEADATAYVICRHFGIECDTADYLLLYDVKPEMIYERMEAVRQTASWIIYQLENRLEQTAGIQC